MTTLFDPGLQPERTELAWRRTALALGAGSLVSMRLLPAALDGAWWALCGVGGLFAAVVLWQVVRRRYRAVNALLARDGDRAALPGASAIVFLVSVVFGVGLVGITVVIVAATA